MIHENVIEEATGASWEWQVHIVYKGNAELRICVDIREANKAVLQEKFPIPQIDDPTIQKSTTSPKIISVLTEVFAPFGNPKVPLSANGPQFTSEEFQGFLKLNGIQHYRTSPYFPNANG